MKWTANKKALEDSGGAYLDLKKIHDTGVSWKQQNPGLMQKEGGRGPDYVRAHEPLLPEFQPRHDL